MDWYLEALKKYARFDGRARRKEYWLFSLFTSLIYIALIVFAFAGIAFLGHENRSSSAAFLVFVPVYLFILAMIIPSLSVTVRRLHDTGRSGWWYFIAFVPFVGAIILLVFTCLDSDPGTNEYGTSPKYGPGFSQMPPFAPPY